MPRDMMSRQKQRSLKTLEIRDLKHLCFHLRTSETELRRICRSPERFYREFPIVRKGKTRLIATPLGRLRAIVDQLNDLLQRLDLPSSIQGGRTGYSNITNALVHVGKPIILHLDIKDFFPWVSSQRVYSAFVRIYGCTPEVARVLTRLVTLHGHLPQGSPTSTIVSALVIAPLARRLEGLADQHRAKFTQYVDDSNLSGPEYLGRLKQTVMRIIEQEGFRVNPNKIDVLSRDREQVVTGVRVNNRLDVPKTALASVAHELRSFERSFESDGIFDPKRIASLRGKVGYVASLNAGAAKPLRRRLERLTRVAVGSARNDLFE